MGLADILALALPIAHFVCSWVFVGASNFVNSPGAVGSGLWTIVSLQLIGVLFYLRAKGEATHVLLGLSFFVLVAANVLFLIIVGTWAYFGSTGTASVTRYSVAIAFSVFDFLLCVGMVVWVFVHPSGGSSGGGCGVDRSG